MSSNFYSLQRKLTLLPNGTFAYVWCDRLGKPVMERNGQVGYAPYHGSHVIRQMKCNCGCVNGLPR
jgi:hypothetical protein